MKRTWDRGRVCGIYGLVGVAVDCGRSRRTDKMKAREAYPGGHGGVAGRGMVGGTIDDEEK